MVRGGFESPHAGLLWLVYNLASPGICLDPTSPTDAGAGLPSRGPSSIRAQQVGPKGEASSHGKPGYGQHLGTSTRFCPPQPSHKPLALCGPVSLAELRVAW